MDGALKSDTLFLNELYLLPTSIHPSLSPSLPPSLSSSLFLSLTYGVRICITVIRSQKSEVEKNTIHGRSPPKSLFILANIYLHSGPTVEWRKYRIRSQRTCVVTPGQVYLTSLYFYAL